MNQAGGGDEGTELNRLPTTVDGLDRVLEGGLIPGRNYMIRGPPGAGKTLLGLHFLTGGEDSLFVNLGESEADVRQDARAFGFNLENVALVDLSPTAEFFAEEQSYEIFPSEQVEGGDVAARITEAIREHDPDRVFVDPLTQFRYLIQDDYQFRKQVLSFLQFLKEQGCTTLFTSQDTASAPDDDLQFMSDGIAHLAKTDTGRTVEVSKFRGSDFQSGKHAVRIRSDGMTVYPRLAPPDHGTEFDPERISTGVTELNELLGGGIERGTVTLVTGPSGVGKTTLGTQLTKDGAGHGERSIIYLFEESRDTFVHRSTAVDIPVESMLERGTLLAREIEALERSPEEFAHDVRHQVETKGARIVMIDGVDGYRLSLRGADDELIERLHALTRYLKNMGVTTILVSEIDDVTGDFQITEHDISYLADNIVILRYLEFQGELRKAIGVLKKRAGDFERTLREFEITERGIKVDEPLSELRGILSGNPEWIDETDHAPSDAD